MRKSYFALICAFLLLGLAACDTDSEPFTAKAGSVTLPAVTVMGGRPVFENDIREILFFSSIIDTVEQKGGEIPYIQLGERIELTFQDTESPYDGVMEQYVINRDGTLKYRLPEPNTVPVEWDGNTLSFALEQDFTSLLSSFLEDYKAGAVYRGFSLRCGSGDDTREYAFVLRSDPSAIFEDAE